MTLYDFLNSDITIEGHVVVKIWDEEKNDCTFLYDNDMGIDSWTVADEEWIDYDINYMYPNGLKNDHIIVIELYK